MNKDPSHRPAGRFSGECCAKNTHVFSARSLAAKNSCLVHIVIYYQCLVLSWRVATLRSERSTNLLLGALTSSNGVTRAAQKRCPVTAHGLISRQCPGADSEPGDSILGGAGGIR